MRLGQAHLERTKAKIKTSMLLKRLEDHALGEIDLTPQQVQSINILLKKTLPDLKASEINATVENKDLKPEDVKNMSKEELKKIANSNNVVGIND